MTPPTGAPTPAGGDLERDIASLAGEVVHAYEELHLLYELGAGLTGGLGPADASRFILDHLLRALDAGWAELSLADGSPPLRLGVPRGAPADPDPLAHPEHRLTTSLRSGGVLVGSLALGRPPARPPFSSADGKLLDAVGTIAANALRSAQLYAELRHQAEALRQSETHLRAVLDNVGEGILTVDEHGAVASFNPGAEQIFGFAADEIVGRHARHLLDPRQADALRATPFDRPPAPGLRQTVGRRKDGSLFPAEITVGAMRSGSQRLFVATVRDVTERSAAQAALEHQALHDALTNLPNRTLLRTRLGQAIADAERSGGALALLLMDLDRFKDLNDTFGHQYGDLLLERLGDRLRRALDGAPEGAADATIARLGGDEFAVLLPRADQAAGLAVAEHLLAALDAPFALGTLNLDIDASIGLALAPAHGRDADTLLRRADVAMYVAKRAGSGCAIYAPEHDQHSPGRLALVGELRRAIDAGELVLYYQPKTAVRGGAPVASEALLRWRHPRHGLVQPDQFIPLAEQTGLIRPLSRWVVDTALQQCRAWRADGLDVSVAVNLSMRNLHDPDLPDMIREVLARHQVPARLLVVEITESSLMADPTRALDVLARLRGLGIGIAIDDFGTGYSSLAYLKRLPVDELKIDRSFVQHLARDPSDAAIVRSTISLAHDLGLRVVAEGVEDQAAWNLLAGLGCDTAQGYFVSRPLPADEFTRWLAGASHTRLQPAADAPLPRPARRPRRRAA